MLKLYINYTHVYQYTHSIVELKKGYVYDNICSDFSVLSYFGAYFSVS